MQNILGALERHESWEAGVEWNDLNMSPPRLTYCSLIIDVMTLGTRAWIVS